MTTFDKLNVLTNEELTMFIRKAADKIAYIESEADKLESAVTTEDVEKRYEELSNWYSDVINIKVKAEEILDSRIKGFDKIFSQIGL